MSRTKKPSRAKTQSRSKKPSRARKSSRGKQRQALLAKPAQIIEILFQNEVTPNRYDDSAAARSGARKGGMLLRQVRGWRVAESLQRLLEQVNQMAPGRSKASDGAIGDRGIRVATPTIIPGSSTAASAWLQRGISPTIHRTAATRKRSPTRSSRRETSGSNI